MKRHCCLIRRQVSRQHRPSWGSQAASHILYPPMEIIVSENLIKTPSTWLLLRCLWGGVVHAVVCTFPNTPSANWFHITYSKLVQASLIYPRKTWPGRRLRWYQVKVTPTPEEAVHLPPRRLPAIFRFSLGVGTASRWAWAALHMGIWVRRLKMLPAHTTRTKSYNQQIKRQILLGSLFHTWVKYGEWCGISEESRSPHFLYGKRRERKYQS